MTTNFLHNNTPSCTSQKIIIKSFGVYLGRLENNANVAGTNQPKLHS